jgi:hypothetical protein
MVLTITSRERESREDLMRAFEMPRRREPRLPDALEVLRAVRAEALGGGIAPTVF